MAIQKIFNAKGRPQDNPLIEHISNIDMPISKSDVKYGYEGEPIANTLVHENYSHGTDNLIP